MFEIFRDRLQVAAFRSATGEALAEGLALLREGRLAALQPFSVEVSRLSGCSQCTDPSAQLLSCHEDFCARASWTVQATHACVDQLISNWALDQL